VRERGSAEVGDPERERGSMRERETDRL